jgi:hypothetical protein
MIEGTIPESLKQIAYLKALDLAFNQLTGSVPIWLANDSVMKNFNLSYMSGSVLDDSLKRKLMQNLKKQF